MRTKLGSGTEVELVVPAAANHGVVVLPDVLGLRPLFDHMAARLASEHGWAVVVPEPFPGREGLPMEDRLASMPQFDAGRQVSDCREAADLLDFGRVGIVGFCLGGTGALRAAADPKYERVVAMYGMIRLPEAWLMSGATDPIDDLARVPGAAAKVLNLAGLEDPYVPEDHQDELARLGARVVHYPGAGHGFVHAPDGPSFRAEDAADAWARAIDWIGCA